jgi:hypothetical protein
MVFVSQTEGSLEVSLRYKVRIRHNDCRYLPQFWQGRSSTFAGRRRGPHNTGLVSFNAYLESDKMDVAYFFLCFVEV